MAQGSTFGLALTDESEDLEKRNSTVSNNDTPAATIQSYVASETTLLTPTSTYFADEKIHIPETEVCRHSLVLTWLNLHCFF